METIKISSHRGPKARGGSPGRLIRADGADDQIRGMFEATQPLSNNMTIVANESTGFAHLQ